MMLQLLPLLLLWAVLGSLVPVGRPGSSRHSLCYSYLKVSEPSQGLPQFLSVVHLDDHPIARYDILTGKTVPLVPWMEAEEMKAVERIFRADLEWIAELNHQTGGLHTWQVDLGCELREDRSKRGFLHYGYDGMDFISFDKETLRWVAAQPQAKKVKETWEDDPRLSLRNKVFLEETCIKRLQRYLPYQNRTRKKTEPPVGKVTGKVVDDSLEVLICQAFGFYPKEIQATWMRDGEVCKYETLPRNVVPNSDGTYYVWLSIEINPKERHRFHCYLEHEGLQEPLILAFKEDPGSRSHSLSYSYLYLPESSQGPPASFIRGYLDDQLIMRYDSLTKKMESLVPWMEKEEEIFQGLKWVIEIDLEKLSKLDHQTGGLHTWQAVLGCELKEDGSKGGFLHYGYNGWDFISFDKETLRWVAAQPQAQKVKDTWELHPGIAQRKKLYLEETCIECLQRYQSYKKDAPQRIEPPVGKVTGKVLDDSLQVLICQAFGFYPKEIQANWMRDGEVCKYETLPRNVAPNSDGTYYVWLSIEINPKERHRFQCHVEHEGLKEPLILAFKEDPVTGWLIPLGIVTALFLGSWIVFMTYKWRSFRKKIPCKVTTHPVNGSPENLPSPSILGIEDEMQSQTMLQPTIT